MSAVLDVFRLIREERLAFWIFLGVNLGFGGMAIWLPPAVATQHHSASPPQEFLNAIEQGNGYLFGLALLAAASSYWLRDYLDSKETDFKGLKLSATLLSFALMIVMAGLLTIVIYQGFEPAFCSGQHCKSPVFWGPIITQIIFTLLALLMATYLFCLERIDNYPEFGKELKDKQTKKIKAGMNGKSSTGFNT